MKPDVTPTKQDVLAAYADCFTVKEAARLLRMSEAHLRTEIRWGRIGPVHRRGRLILLPASTVRAQFVDAADPVLVALRDALPRPGTADMRAGPAPGKNGGRHTVRAG